MSTDRQCVANILHHLLASNTVTVARHRNALTGTRDPERTPERTHSSHLKYCKYYRNIIPATQSIAKYCQHVLLITESIIIFDTNLPRLGRWTGKRFPGSAGMERGTHVERAIPPR